MADLLAVARSVFPEGNAAAWRALAAYADNTDTHLAAITSLVVRARWHAKQSGRALATPDDLRHTMRECGTPQFIGARPAMRPPAPRENFSVRKQVLTFAPPG